MIPAAFDYQRASTIDEALDALSSGDGSVKLLAGGQSLLPLLKMRLAFTDKLVDIGRIAELKGVRQLDDGRLAIGALTTYAELIGSPADAYGLLRDVLPIIGDLQVRNRGTIGGSIAHADPASDLPACLVALDAEIIARSSRGERVIPVGGFFQGPFQTDLADDEILTEVRLPGRRDDAGSAYVSLEQPASGYALVGVAAVVFGSGGGGRGIGSAKVGITGVGDHAYRPRGVEEALAGSDGSEASIAAAAAHAADGIEVANDIHADREYRTAMAAVYTRRAIEAALTRLTA
jgi:carbon-monoxide dehydrogenase medium subunit